MKLFLTILFALTLNRSFSQMKVEDIKNDKNVIAFINEWYPETKSQYYAADFCNDAHALPVTDEPILRFYDSIKSNKRCFTTDINHDGGLDLVFSGCVEDRNRVMLFLSDTGRGYIRLEVMNEFGPYNQFAYKGRSDTVFAGGLDIKHVSGEMSKLVLRIDTIVFVNGNVIEANTFGKKKNIDSIFFNIGDFFAHGVGRRITIYKNKDISLSIIGKDDKSRHKPLSNSSQVGNKIVGIAETLPYYKYLPQYDGRLQDGGYWNTTIFFSDHTKLVINDHGAIAPFGLQLIYKYAGDIYDNQENWQWVSARKNSSP